MFTSSFLLPYVGTRAGASLGSVTKRLNPTLGLTVPLEWDAVLGNCTALARRETGVYETVSTLMIRERA